MEDPDRTASLMSPAKLAEFKPKAAASPAAWLNQMAADAAHQHVKRLGELRKELKLHAKERDYSVITTDLAQLAKVLPTLDFGLVQTKGLWARVSGKSKSAAAEFSSQFESLQKAAAAVSAQAKALQQSQKDQAAGTDMALLEFEVEYRAIEKVLDQGARWLQDMRNQLKTRQAEGGDAAAKQQIVDDEKRCEILVARLKVLRGVSSAAQAAHQQVQAAAARRAGFPQKFLQSFAAKVKDWTDKVESLAASAAEGEASGLDAAMESHRELQLFVKELTADCAQLQVQETSLAQSLSALKAQVETAKVS
jgi:hypothetical protein